LSDTNNELLLIGVTYSLAEAKHILLSLLDDKIKFHNNIISCREESYELTHEYSVERVEALKEIKAYILKLVASVDNDNQKIKIHSSISVKIM